MLGKYLDDYYTNGITARKIAELEGISEHKIGYMFREQGIPTVNQLINSLDFEDKELRRTLRNKYTSIANRCKFDEKTKKGSYEGLYYLPLPKYVKFCNDNKKLVNEIWGNYIDSNKQLKLALSIDRVNPDKGYFVENMRFTTHGYNSYRANTNPCEVVYKGEGYYFMSAEEGSRYFGIRRQDIGECMRGVKYHNKDFAAKSVDMDIVLKESNVGSLEEYYDKFINID